MSRGVLYMVWGEGYADALQRSIDSLKRWHPELSYHVAQMPPDATVLCKARMWELSPFDETLFLDADTEVFGRLDYGFEEASLGGIACCISANPWQRRYHRLPALHHDAAEYSSGAVFFDKSSRRAGEIFNRWMGCGHLNSATRYAADNGEILEQAHNDQALFTWAMWCACFRPIVLPQNWNLCPKWQKSFFGPVKILHGHTEESQDLERWNADQSAPGAVIRYARFAEEGE